MAEVSKIIPEKQTIHGMEKGQPKTPKKTEKNIITYRRISKRLAVDTTSLYCSFSINSTNHSCSSLLKRKHAISITCTEIHADHIVSSGSPHNNVLHFSSYYYICMVRPSPARRYRDCTGVRDIFQHDLEAA